MRGLDGHSEQQQFCLYTVHSPGTVGNCRDQLEHDVDNCAVVAQQQPVDSVLRKAEMNVTGQELEGATMGFVKPMFRIDFMADYTAIVGCSTMA